MAYTLHWESRGLVSVFSGRVGMDEIREVEARFQADDRWASTRYHILDFRQAHLILSRQDVQAMAHSVDVFYETMAPLAHATGLIATDPNARALLEAYIASLRTTHTRACLCGTMTEARAWCARVMTEEEADEDEESGATARLLADDSESR